MTRILAAITVLFLLTGCAATLPKVSASDGARVKQGKSAVLFLDDVEQINYLQDKYYVLAVTQEGSNSVYRGLWDSSKQLSSISAEELAKIGIPSTSVYDLLAGPEVTRLTEADKTRFTFMPRAPGTGKAPRVTSVSPELRQALLDKGQKHLIWVSWTGYQLHIMTLGLAPTEQFLLRFWVVDLEQNKFLGGGDVRWFAKLDLGEQTGKEFLEANDLAGLKAQVEKDVRASIASTQAVAKATGLPVAP